MRLKAFVLAAMIMSLGMLSTSMTSAQIDVPTAVKTAFQNKFPTAKKVKWELEKEGEYEAEFKLNGVETSANFQEDGTWIGTETEIKHKDLPQAVKGKIAELFSGYEVEEVELCEKPDQPSIYEVELENAQDDTKIKAEFAADGNLIRQTNEDDEDQEEEDHK